MGTKSARNLKHSARIYKRGENMENETTIKIENIDDLKKLLDTAKEQCEQLTETIEKIQSYKPRVQVSLAVEKRVQIALVKKESRLHS